MKLQVYPKLVFRTPKFSYQTTLHDSWDELKSSISISSSSFYQTIKDIQAHELGSLPPKVLFTIWKYFNRSKYRATPYGTFASFSITDFSVQSDNTDIIVQQDLKLHEYIDWPVKNEVNFSFADLIRTNGSLQSNSSWYKVLNAFRYIACTEGQFELAEIDKNELVERILIACAETISLSALVDKLGISKDELESFYELLADMHSIQLLFSNFDPNIIGEDYFERLNIQSLFTEKPKYIIAERKVLSGSLNTGYNKDLILLIQKLHQLAPQVEHKSLNSFINKFRIKFEQREVALLDVLDPEIGIGYDNLEQAGKGDDFISELLNKSNKNKHNRAKDLLKPIFYKNNSVGTNAIFLDSIINTSAEYSKLQNLPNSFSALFTIAEDETIVLEQIGGSTANALNGRFTMVGNEVLNCCRSIAEIEAKANPDVLFFEVAYMVENTIDNVNRRKLIYNYQLSILNYNTSDAVINLDDILISIVNNEVILRSKKYNKRLVPRIASAYNYNRSDLSIFRLFCDLQHQNIQSNLLFSLSDIFPDQLYYPRFQFKKIVLSLAKWKVLSKDLLVTSSKEIAVEDCRKILKKIKIPRYFKTGNADQTLTFDIENDLDIQSFIFYMQKNDELWLEEVLLPNKPTVMDENGQPYLAQFVTAFYHEDEVYKGVLTSNKSLHSNPVKKIFPPGSEWLYFEIYCHQQRSDYLLCTSIIDFVNNENDKIKTWFFIRYNEHGDHLRFRILLNNEQDGYYLTSEFTKSIRSLLAEGIVSDILVKTYKREIERYSDELIEEAEFVFSSSSQLVIAVLQRGFDNDVKYKLCLILIERLINASVFSFDEMKFLIKKISDSFNNEHNLATEDFKKINAQYQIFKTSTNSFFDEELADIFDNFTVLFVEILSKCTPNRKMNLFGDLMHMHVNRLFNKDQRTHEMVMYYFALKDIQRLNALNNKNN